MTITGNTTTTQEVLRAQLRQATIAVLQMRIHAEREAERRIKR